MNNEYVDQKKLDIQFSHLFLFSGKDLKIGKYTIKHPTIQNIVDLKNKIRCEDLYWQMISLLMSDPYENMVMLDDMGIDYESISSFDVFTINWKKYRKLQEINNDAESNPLELMKYVLTFFLGEHDWEMLDISPTMSLLIDQNDPGYIINADIFELIVEFIKQIHCFNYQDRVNPQNNTFKRILIEDMRDEQERRKNDIFDKNKNKPTNIIGSMVSGICAGGNGGINIFNVYQLSIYQLNQYFIIAQNKNKVDKLLTGIYAGTIVADKLNEKDFKWTV